MNQKGFSLIELMIAMLIGLIVIAGTFSVLESTQATNRVSAALDARQDSVRYTAYTISRLVSVSSSINTSTASSLSLSLPADPNVRNCIGQPLTTAEVNVISVINNQLTCTIGTTDWPLVEPIESVVFTYGADTNNDNRVSAAEYTAAPGNWNEVVSVSTSITIPNYTIQFISTSRVKALTQLGESL